MFRAPLNQESGMVGVETKKRNDDDEEKKKNHWGC
jgi:hypothetical protein